MTAYENGTIYEKYVQSIIAEKYKYVWLWNDVPNNVSKQLNFYNSKTKKICDDIGCDIIAQNHDDTFDFIQCKNYSTTGEHNIINICDLAGFYNFMYENDLHNGIVYYTGKLSSQIVLRNKRTTFMNLPFFNIDLDDKIKLIPRDYQIEAYNSLKNVSKGILNMPCGTGKTFVEYMLSLDHKITVILTPLISTTQQAIKHFTHYYDKDDVNIIEISSEGERDHKKIKLVDKNIICATYDSCDVVNKLSLGDPLIIIDEFHNLTEKDYNKKSEIGKILSKQYKTIFVSATPKLLKEYDYGCEYKLDWSDAIKKKYICEYNFCFPDNDTIKKSIVASKINTKIVDKSILFDKAYFLLEKVKECKMKKVIVYLKSIEELTDFIKIMAVVNIFFEIDYAVHEIHYKINKKKREVIMKKFRNDKKVSIICNVQVLNEGIDVPKCDGVYVTHPNNNRINLVQRISRCNRKDEENVDKVGNVLVWTKSDDKMKQICDFVGEYIKIDMKGGKMLNKEQMVVQKNKKKVINIQNICKLFGCKIDEIHTVMQDDVDVLWFNSKQICHLLKYVKHKNALGSNVSPENKKQLQHLVSDYKSLYKNVQGQSYYINEKGLCELILKSNKMNVKGIQKQLLSEIMPMIEK